MQAEHARSVEGNALRVIGAAARHVDARRLALQHGVGPQGQHALFAAHRIVSLGTVSRSIYIGKRGGTAAVHQDAPVHRAACVRHQLRVRPHTHGRYQHVEFQLRSALEPGRVSPECGRAVVQVKTDALLLHTGLHHGSRRVIQYSRQHAGRKVRNGDLRAQAADALGAFDAREARAQNEHAALRPQRLSQSRGVGQRLEAKGTLHRFQPGNGRHERAAARGRQQPVVSQPLACREPHGPVSSIQRGGQHAGFHRHTVPGKKAVRPAPHFVPRGLALQQIRNERTGIIPLRLSCNENDLAGFVHGADALDTADGCCAAADDDVPHAPAPLSSKTMALFGQCSTQAGTPPLWVHSSHFCTAPCAPGRTAP